MDGLVVVVRIHTHHDGAALKEKPELDAFLLRNGFRLIELYDGALTDLGGIMFLEACIFWEPLIRQIILSQHI